MRGLFRLITICLFVLAACSPAEEPLPTLNPSPTTAPATETATATPTRRPMPTPEPTQILARTDAIRAEEQSYLRVIHASPALNQLDVYIQQLNVASFIDYGQYTDPGGITAGEYSLRILPAGIQDAPYLEESIRIDGEQSLILMIYGTPESLQYRLFDETPAPLDPGLARVRILNGLPSGQTLDVNSSGQNLALTLPVYELSEYSVLNNGNYELNIIAGQINWQPYSLNLRERQQVTLLIAGTEASPSIIELTVTAPGITQIRFINVSFDLLAVNAFVNTQQIAANIGYGNSSERVSVPAQFYSLIIRDTEASEIADPLLEIEFAANPDTLMTLVLIGNRDSLRIVTHIDDMRPLEADSARISFLNTLTEQPRILLDTSALVQENTYFYGQISQPQIVLNGSYSLSWVTPLQSDMASEVLEFVPNLQLEAGSSYLYLVAGRGTDTPFIYADQVTIIPDEAEIAMTPGIAPEQEPTRLRIINAMPGLIADFSVAEATFSTQLNYGQSSPSVFVSAGPTSFSATESTTGLEVARSELDLQFGRDYSVLMYPAQFDAVEFFLLDETGITPDPAAPTLRLINLTRSGRPYALATSAVSPQPSAPSSEGETGPAETRPEQAANPRLPSIPFGTDRVTTEIQPGTASLALASIASLGPRDIYIIDVGAAGVAVRIFNVQLEPGQRYDVVLLEDASQQLQGFVVAYPSNQ